MAEILWHRRETRRKTENTNFTPAALEGLSLLDRYTVERQLLPYPQVEDVVSPHDSAN